MFAREVCFVSRCQQKLSLQYVQSLRGTDARAAELDEANKELSARIGELESAARSSGDKNSELVQDLELKITHLQQSFTRQAFARQSDARQCQQLANQVLMLETMIKQHFGDMLALHQIEANAIRWMHKFLEDFHQMIYSNTFILFQAFHLIYFHYY